jgi:Ni/Co efflux regulator RcnB
MRKLILAAAIAATAAPMAFAAPADAQYRSNVAREQRRTRTRAEYNRELRECRRETRRANREDWRAYRNYDYNRYENGTNAYYADRYYRDGRYYGEVRLGRNDRIYRGSNGQYYCRRSDGTTGLIVGGAVGALIGNSIDNGRSSLLGTLIGAGAGAALGSEIERGSIRCR